MFCQIRKMLAYSIDSELFLRDLSSAYNYTISSSRTKKALGFQESTNAQNVLDFRIRF